MYVQIWIQLTESIFAHVYGFGADHIARDNQ